MEGAGSHNHGATITLTATANEGYYFVNWTKDDDVVSTNATYSFTATAAGNYVANFAAYDVHNKTIEANKWYAISSPVHNNNNDETLEGVTNLTSGTYDLFGYTESTGTWNQPTTVLEQGKGYIYRAAADVTLSFVGIINSAVPAYNLSNECDDADLQGFNLVGNPYHVPATPGMYCYSLTDKGTWLAHESYQVPVCEAVLVKATDIVNQVSFTPSTKGNTSSAAIALTVSNDEFEDVAYAMFDNGEGLPKIGHLTANAPMLSIPVDGRRYAIADLGMETESFDLNFNAPAGQYTISASNVNEVSYMHLIDRLTAKDIDLKSQSYTFNATGNDANRFMVKLSPSAVEDAIGNFIYWNGNAWTVEGTGTLQVFDVLGRQISSQEVDSQTTIRNSQFPSAGVYVLRLGEKSQKIVVK